MVDKNFVWVVFLILQVSPVSSFSSFSESATGANLTEQRHLRLRREVDCNNLKQENMVQEIIKKPCTFLKASSIYEFKINGEHNDWNAYINGLQHIENINFVFDGTSVTTIDINNPFPISTSSLIIRNNNDLTLVKVQKLELNWGLVANDNPNLKTIELDAGTFTLIAPIVCVENNAQLETIDMEKLTKMDIKEAVSIQQNENLKTIKMGSLNSFTANSMIVVENPALDKFEMPKLTDFTVKEETSISNNRLLTEINFNQDLAGTFSTSSLEIKQNKKLANVAIKADKVKAHSLKVRGNPNLSEESLANLNKIVIEKGTESGDIQEFGECIFDDGPVKLLSELDHCVVISGGVNFTSSTSGSKPGQLTTINGDVDLDGLESDAVAFLSKVTINGTIKSSICDFKLPPHNVSSPACPSTTTTITRAISKPPATTTAATTTVAPSTQAASSGGLSSWWPTLTIVGAVGIGIIVVFIVLFCIGLFICYCEFTGYCWCCHEQDDL